MSLEKLNRHRLLSPQRGRGARDEGASAQLWGSNTLIERWVLHPDPLCRIPALSRVRRGELNSVGYSDERSTQGIVATIRDVHPD